MRRIIKKKIKKKKKNHKKRARENNCKGLAREAIEPGETEREIYILTINLFSFILNNIIHGNKLKFRTF